MALMTIKRFRRRYFSGTCQDCGRHKRVTWVTFWVNGYRMRVCAECIKPYRRVILRGSHLATDYARTGQ